MGAEDVRNGAGGSSGSVNVVRGGRRSEMVMVMVTRLMVNCCGYGDDNSLIYQAVEVVWIHASVVNISEVLQGT